MSPENIRFGVPTPEKNELPEVRLGSGLYHKIAGRVQELDSVTEDGFNSLCSEADIRHTNGEPLNDQEKLAIREELQATGVLSVYAGGDENNPEYDVLERTVDPIREEEMGPTTHTLRTRRLIKDRRAEKFAKKYADKVPKRKPPEYTARDARRDGRRYQVKAQPAELGARRRDAFNFIAQQAVTEEWKENRQTKLELYYEPETWSLKSQLDSLDNAYREQVAHRTDVNIMEHKDFQLALQQFGPEHMHYFQADWLESATLDIDNAIKRQAALQRETLGLEPEDKLPRGMFATIRDATIKDYIRYRLETDYTGGAPEGLEKLLWIAQHNFYVDKSRGGAVLDAHKHTQASAAKKSTRRPGSDQPRSDSPQDSGRVEEPLRHLKLVPETVATEPATAAPETASETEPAATSDRAERARKNAEEMRSAYPTHFESEKLAAYQEALKPYAGGSALKQANDAKLTREGQPLTDEEKSQVLKANRANQLEALQVLIEDDPATKGASRRIAQAILETLRTPDTKA